MPRLARVRVEVLTSTGRLKELFVSSSRFAIRIVHVLELMLSVCSTIIAALLNTIAYVPVLNYVATILAVATWLWTLGDLIVDNTTRGLLDLKSLLGMLLEDLKRARGSTAQLYKTYRVGPVVFTVAIPADMFRVAKKTK